MTTPDLKPAPFSEMKHFRVPFHEKYDISINDKNTVFTSLI
jgi:hypothetical protein